MEGELRFSIERVDNNLIDMFFESPEDTKTAYRAIRKYLGDDADGILLIAKPRYAIILDRSQNGWNIWCQRMRPFVDQGSLHFHPKGPKGEEYSLIVRNGSLVPIMSHFLPMVMEVGGTDV